MCGRFLLSHHLKIKNLWRQMRMTTMDYPNVRANIRCPLCPGGKEAGLLVCWPCYRAQGFRYGNPEAERSIKRAEDNLQNHLDAASTKRGQQDY